MSRKAELPNSITVALSGHEAEWNHLKQRIFTIIDSVAKHIEGISGSTATMTNTGNQTADALKDIMAIAADFVKAKLEKPSLENVKLRAEIINLYAEAKKNWAEASKAEAEAQRIQAEGIGAYLDNLERLMKFADIIGKVQFARIGNNAHLIISAKSDDE